MKKTDEEIAASYIRGETKEFDALVERYIDRIYSFALRMTGNEELSKDAVQDTFIKVWKSLDKFDERRNFRTWIFSIARNAVIDLLRKRTDIVFSKIGTEEDDFEETIPDKDIPLDEKFEIKEKGKALEKLLATLPERKREIVLLHDAEGLTFEEIASMLGRKMNTVKSDYRRAILALQQAAKGNNAPK